MNLEALTPQVFWTVTGLVVGLPLLTGYLWGVIDRTRK